MKKPLLVLVIGMLLGTAVFADHEGLGIGITGGGGGGLGYGGVGNVGLSLKLPQLPIFWAVYGNFVIYYPGLGITADYYIFDEMMVEKRVTGEDGAYYELKLHWYLGMGIFANMHPYSDGAFFNLGVRVPAGLSWHIIRPVEMFLAVVPGIGLSNWKTNPFHFGLNGEIGLRYWFISSKG
jgi:hypothetical protein